MNGKKSLRLIITTVLTITLLCSVLVVYLDPFFHYHKPLSAFAYDINNQSYQNPGIVRHFDYNSLICGSSMVELLLPSQFEQELGLQAVKVPYSGGTTKNMNIIVEQAFQHHSDLKYIFWGLDLYALNAEKDALKMDLPQYLYDDNPFTDLSYLLNKEVLFTEIPHLLDSAVEKDTTFDAAYNWWDENKNRYNKNTVLSYLDIPIGTERQADIPAELSDHVISNVQENILPLVIQHPDTEFVFFVPPYSILYWHSDLISGRLQSSVANLDYAVTELLPYDNVSVFFFPDMTENTQNLYQYMDLMHYSPKVAADMVHCFSTMEHQLNTANKEAVFQNFVHSVETFDYTTYTDGAAFQSVEQLNEYLPAIKSDRYIICFMTNQTIGQLNQAEIDLLTTNGFLCDDFNPDQYIVQIFSGDQLLYQECSSEPICGSKVTNDIEITFATASDKNAASIMIDAAEYCPESKVINMVIYDKELHRVIDSCGLRDDTRVLTNY